MKKCCICENELNDGQPISILTYRGLERINRSNDEHSGVCAAAIQITEIPGYRTGKFVQFVADNVDDNTRTIDGKEHSMAWA